MAGNVWEWTTGHNITDGQLFVVPRGGWSGDSGSISPVVRAHGDTAIAGYHFHLGFRVVLYIK